MSNLLGPWDNIQKEVVVCREHQIFFSGMPNAVLKHPYLNQLLPGLLLIRAVCIFESALREYLLEKGESKSKIEKSSLFSLIELSSIRKAIEAKDGHTVRIIRNDIAHERKTITWDELEQFLATIENFLNVDILHSFGRKPRNLSATKQRLSGPDADPNTRIHIRITGILRSDDGNEETVFSYDEKS